MTVKPEEVNVVVFREKCQINIPDLYYRIYIEADDPEEYRKFTEMFVKATCWKADSLEEADLVIFGGGADVQPNLYNQVKHPSTRTDYHRDLRDQALYSKCFEKGIPMLGVCRGAQFGHVMNGGSLYQDVDNHGASHSFLSVGDAQTFITSSSHHQMVKPQKGMEVLGVSAGISTKRWLDPLNNDTGHNRDIEAFFYEESGFFGVQGHPEYYGYPQFTHWTIKMLQTLFDHNPLYELRGNLRRLKEEHLEKRLTKMTLKELM